MHQLGVHAVGGDLRNGGHHAVVHNDGVALGVAVALAVAVDTGHKGLLGVPPGHRPGDHVGAAALAVQVYGKVGLGFLLAVGHDLLFNNQRCIGAQIGLGAPQGRVHTLDLGGLHLHIGAFLHVDYGGGVHHVLSPSVALAVVALHIAHPGIFAHIEGVDSVVTGLLYTAVVDTAAGYDGHIAALAYKKVVVHHVLQAALAEDHGDMDRFVLRARLDENINAVLIVLGDDIDISGGAAGSFLAVGPDIIGPFGHIVELCHLLQQALLNGVDHCTFSLLTGSYLPARCTR